MTNTDRPSVLESETYKIVSSQGNIYVTIAGPGPDELFIWVGKHGSEIATLTYTLGTIISRLMEMEEISVLDIIRMLKGIRGEFDGWFNGSRFSSLPEAVACALENWLERHKMAEESEES